MEEPLAEMDTEIDGRCGASSGWRASMQSRSIAGRRTMVRLVRRIIFQVCGALPTCQTKVSRSIELLYMHKGELRGFSHNISS
jgi:hypothetical protein